MRMKISKASFMRYSKSVYVYLHKSQHDFCKFNMHVGPGFESTKNPEKHPQPNPHHQNLHACVKYWTLCFCRICAQQMMTTLWHRMTPCWCLLMRVRGLNLDLSALCSCPSVMEIRTSSICRTGDLSSEDWLICLLEEKKSDMCSDHYIGVCI